MSGGSGMAPDYTSAPDGEQFPAAAPADGKRYGADVIVDLLHAYDVEYVSLNPGASFRGLQDSLVNYGAGVPPIILCQAEGIAVSIAHGYARARGATRPMAVILHNVVGLLNGALAIYQAYIDRAPVLILGGTGPISTSRRRPGVDWRHTANVQGNAVRDFVKWDDQPAAVADFPHSFGRAYRVAMTEPAGPIYLCYDADLQEDPIEQAVPLPKAGTSRMPTRMAADPVALDRVAEMLIAADHPVIVTEFLGRDHTAPAHLIRLAELLAIPVISQRTRPNFPTCHPLNLTGSDVLRDADLVLALDAKELERPTVRTDQATRERRSLVPPDASWIEMGFADLEIGSWASDQPRMMPTNLSILADTSLAVPALAELVEQRLRGDEATRARIRERTSALHERHRKLRADWLNRARQDWDAKPMTTGRLMLELWDAIKSEDWVLSGGHHIVDQALQLWDVDLPYRYPGGPLGPGSQIGLALGTALANKGTGRLVIDLQPDGDLLYDAGALWVAAKHELPMLVVMFNNRAYYQDWEHQTEIARTRGTPLERASVGMDLRGPSPDFATLARSMGCFGEGPIEDARELTGALRRAIAEVKKGRLALVDAVTRFR
jgi:acetolactate synthase I/II/III large subunit